MIIKTELHSSDYIRDEDLAPGESTMSANIYAEFPGIMPSQKEKAREIINRFYQELRTELHNIG